MSDTLRSLTVSLKSILRTDLPDEHRHLFINCMQATSIQLTDMKSDLAAILHALMFEPSSRRFVIEDDQVCLNDVSRQTFEYRLLFAWNNDPQLVLPSG
jgi:hypothetical protein